MVLLWSALVISLSVALLWFSVTSQDLLGEREAGREEKEEELELE